MSMAPRSLQCSSWYKLIFPADITPIHSESHDIKHLVNKVKVSSRFLTSDVSKSLQQGVISCINYRLL